MSDAVLLNPDGFFDFVGQARPVVVFLSGHPLHRLNPHLAQTCAQHISEEAVLAQLSLSELNQSAFYVLAFLQQEIEQNQIDVPFPIPPGYFLFYRSQLISWRFGLPASGDVGAVLRGSILGAAFSWLTRDPRFFGQALWMSSERQAATRMARDFAKLYTDFLERPRPRFSYRYQEQRSFFSQAGAESEIQRAYRTLELDPSASDEEVHRAWRRLQKKYHPDRAARHPEEFERLSRRCAEINQARDTIRRHRGTRYRRAAA